MERGHQLAKYISCCAASQCAETHICSRRVTRAGAAACKHCGGAGGGSQWTQAFAAALCEIFECPAGITREALGLVLSAVAFAPATQPSSLSESDPDDGSRSSDGNDGFGGVRRDREGGVDNDEESEGAGNGERYPGSDGEESALGSSWESVSSTACEDLGVCGDGEEAKDVGKEEFEDDDEAVRKGIWFPPPCSSSFSSSADARLLVSDAPSARDSVGTDRSSVRRAGSGDGRGVVVDGSVASVGVGGAWRSAPAAPVAAYAPGAPGGSEAFFGATGSRYRGERDSGARWRLQQPVEDVGQADDGAGIHQSDARSNGYSGLSTSDDAGQDEGASEFGGGEAGSEFVVLVSREATVRELASSVGEFPKEWLEEAFGLVVQRQVEEAAYDARARAALKRAVRLLEGRVSWKQVALIEQELAARAHHPEGHIQDGEQNKEAPVSGRYWKVGLAAAGGGVLLFLSGGVAAPSVTASLSAVGFAAANSVSYVAPTLGAWLGYTSASAAAAAATTSAAGVGSVGAFSAVSGAAGASLAGYKMTRRTAGVQEFHFLPLHSRWPLDAPESKFEGASEPGLPVFICIPGWHEPGHDPRHTWGGVGYVNASTPGTTLDDVPPPIAYTVSRDVAGGSSPANDTAGEGVPVSEATGTSDATTPATAAFGRLHSSRGTGSAISRWFSALEAMGSESVVESSETVRSETVLADNDTPSGPHAHTRAGGAGGCRTFSRNFPMEREGVRREDSRVANRNLSPEGRASPTPAPAPMACSFIDLGASRTHRGHSDRHCSAKREGDAAGGGAGTVSPRQVLGASMVGRIREAGSDYARNNDNPSREAQGTDLEDSWESLPSHAWWRDFVTGGEEHVLVWERGPLTELHAAMRDLAWKSASRRAVNEALKRSALAPVVAAAALPLALLDAASGLDDPWGVVRSRALEAGRLLAAVLLSRPVGSRPVTLLGYSMGAKVVFNCLEALAAAPGDRGLGVVENAVMLGTPVGTKRGRWKRARSAVAGRLINGYSSRDWLLALVYRSKSWSVGVAGTSRVEGCGVENVDLSGLVTWHLSYSRILPTVMAMLRLEE